MRIYVRSNFVVPGLDNGEFVNLDQSQLTLWEFLEGLSEKAPTRVEYVRPGAQTINPDEWEIRIGKTFLTSVAEEGTKNEKFFENYTKSSLNDNILG